MVVETEQVLPFMLNANSQGRAWRESGVAQSQMRRAHGFIAEDFPALHQWMSARVDEAVAKGWLKDE